MPIPNEQEPKFTIYPRKPGLQYDSYGKPPEIIRSLNRMVRKIKAANNPRRVVVPGTTVVRTLPFLREEGRWAWRAAGKYLAFNKTGQETPWQVFNNDGPVENPREIAGKWHEEGDYRVYKIVISPADTEGMDLTKLTQDLVKQLNQETFLTGAKGPLEYMAAAHYDTTYHHVHLLLRGKAGGEDFMLPPEYIRYGLRRHVANLKDAQRHGLKKELGGLSVEL